MEPYSARTSFSASGINSTVRSSRIWKTPNANADRSTTSYYNSYNDIKERVRRYIDKSRCKQEAFLDHNARVTNEISEIMGNRMPDESPSQRLVAHQRGLHAFDLAMNPDIESALRTSKLKATGSTITSRVSSNTNTTILTDNNDRSTSIKAGSIDRHSTLRESTDLHRTYKARLIFPKTIHKNSITLTTDIDRPLDVAWLDERLEISCRQCRFELPFDMLKLENMSVLEYLLKYCRIPEERQIFYHKHFDKYLQKSKKVSRLMSFKDLDKVLRSLLVVDMDSSDLAKLYVTLTLKEGSMVDRKLFTVICVVAERILYVTIVGRRKGCGGVRSFLEIADFSSLESKLQGVHIDAHLKKLLFSLG